MVVASGGWSALQELTGAKSVHHACGRERPEGTMVVYSTDTFHRATELTAPLSAAIQHPCQLPPRAEHLDFSTLLG